MLNAGRPARMYGHWGIDSSKSLFFEEMLAVRNIA